MQEHYQQVDTLLPGTILLFWLHRPRIQQHLGVMSYDNRFIHAWWDVKKVVEMELTDVWQNRIDSLYDYRWQP